MASLEFEPSVSLVFAAPDAFAMARFFSLLAGKNIDSPSLSHSSQGRMLSSISP